MNLQSMDLETVLVSNHPARPYLLFGALACGIGLFKNSLTGALMVAGGTAAIVKGVSELQKCQRLHGGNFHGHNGPPSKKLEEQISMI